MLSWRSTLAILYRTFTGSRSTLAGVEYELRHFIDDIKIPSKTGRGYLHRVDEVFDCW